MRVVITGATGAIGIAFLKELIKRQNEVLVICHKDSSRKDRIPESSYVSVLELNLDEYREFTPDPTDAGYDVFVHMAWQGTTGCGRENVMLQHQNAEYALEAVELAHRLGCHTFMGVGSQAEYGRVEGKLSPDTPTFPETCYGIAKLYAGQITRKRCEQLGIRHIWVRVLSVYGPYDSEHSMILSTIRKMLAGEKVSFTAGEQMWDYLYSVDAAQALCLLIENGKHGRIYPLGSGKAKPLREYICQMRDAVNSQAEVALGEIPYAPGQVMYLCADLEAITQDTGFTPETEYEEGIKNTIDWVRLEGENDD